MCTVTFIPAKNTFYLTSNRDEKTVRPPALPPENHLHRENYLMYPQDTQGSGTWIVARGDGNAGVLLNGAFEAHTRTPPYRQSRGIIMLQILSSPQPTERFLFMDLRGIEPFTVILWQKRRLYECRWDGMNKHFQQHDHSTAHIWSSATLYHSTVRTKRERWFAQWLRENPFPTQDNILMFHLLGGEGDISNDLRINRSDKIMTVSITSIQLDNNFSVMRYIDLKENKQFVNRPIQQRSRFSEWIMR